MSKHTQGPWRVVTRSRTSNPDRFGRTTDTHETFINGADGLGSIAKLYVGHESDAPILAAAPEMYEALRELVRVQGEGSVGELKRATAEAAAILAKLDA